MRRRLRRAAEQITSSLWAVPALLVAGACGLAALTLLVDERNPSLSGLRPWLFGGTAAAARDLLTSVAGSLITVAALAFSVTIVAIQQASSQFSPRVIRNFMRDRGNQAVFGAYVATFVYALLVLRQVREDQGGSGFVPALSVTAALALALICVVLLIYFIHHTARSLQVATIADNISRELRAAIAHLYPPDGAREGNDASPGPHAPPAVEPALTLHAPGSGFLSTVDIDRLLDALPPGVTAARVRPQIGDYVFAGEPLVDLWAVAPPERRRVDRVLAACALESERSFSEDPRFGIRQLVDIALKALSPGINDPTTAEHCLAHLGDALARLARRRTPEASRRAPDGSAIVFQNWPDFAQLVDAAFGQIRRAAAGNVHVTNYLLDVLARIAQAEFPPPRAAGLRQQISEVLAVLDQQGFSPADSALLRARAFAALAAIEDRQSTVAAATVPQERP